MLGKSYMKRLVQSGFIVCLFALKAANAGVTAEEIVSRSDAIRNPSGSFAMETKITQYENGSISDEMVVKILSKPEENSGSYRTLVEILKPAKDHGKLILRNVSDLWFYDPSSKASVRISPQQRLLGQVSNGDVMSSNFALDYASVILGEEVIRDATKTKIDCYVVELSATSSQVTYPKIEYWVAKSDFRPVKGRFYAASGGLLKVAYYTKFKQILDAKRPTEVLIIDGIDVKKVTKMSFSSYKVASIPEYWFQRSWLERYESQ